MRRDYWRSKRSGNKGWRVYRNKWRSLLLVITVVIGIETMIVKVVVIIIWVDTIVIIM